MNGVKGFDVERNPHCPFQNVVRDGDNVNLLKKPAHLMSQGVVSIPYGDPCSLKLGQLACIKLTPERSLVQEIDQLLPGWVSWREEPDEGRGVQIASGAGGRHQ